MDGLHLTADLRGCAPEQALMTRTERLRQLCVDAVAAAGLHPVGELFHRFEPARPHAGEHSADEATAADSTVQGGITGMVLLAESHLAVHTWPELGVVTIDVYVCNFGADNGARAHRLLDALTTAFEPAAVERQALRRGRPALDAARP